MFKVDGTTIMLTRGDVATIEISCVADDGQPYTFQSGDIVRLNVMERNRHDVIILSKDVQVSTNSDTVDIALSSDETRIGSIINKPVDYWYEIQVNPDTACKTIIGYDEDGPKTFRLYPEGDDKA